MNKAYLIILDGLGLASDYHGNAVTQASAPYLQNLISGNKHPMGKLKNHGQAVGLPEFQVGGSEAGHITIGAGRPIKLLLTKINDAIEDGSFKKNSVLKNLFSKAQKNQRIHFMGLCSDGGIHSFQPHVLGLQQMAKEYDIENIFHHCFLDGRDVGLRTAETYLKSLEEIGANISSIMGRFYSMDRDHNWERTQAAYNTLTGKNAPQKNWAQVLQNHYQNTDESDYYLKPVLLNPNAAIKKSDIVLFWNFRTDRARQLSEAFLDKDFPHFERSVVLDAYNFGAFGDFYQTAQKPFNFETTSVAHTLGEVVSQHGGKQLRIAETEKYNHVTFFFSGETKEKFKGEDTILVPSPKCANYAEKPAMSAPEVTQKALEAIEKENYQLVIHNFANPDLVGHSGNLSAAIAAVEEMDKDLQIMIPKLLEHGYDILITSDHGNCDEMIYPNGDPSASHTKAPTPLVLISNKPELQKCTIKDGALGNIAPTILDLLDLEKPSEMLESLVLK